MSKGYVYVLSNPSMPGLVKVGWSKYSGQQRADQLYRTGTPLRFVVAFEIMSTLADDLEHATHRALSRHRVNDGREFFSCSINEAVECIIEHFIKLHSNGLKLTDFCIDEDKPEPQQYFAPPEPEPMPTEEGRARARATLAGLRALISDEVKA